MGDLTPSNEALRLRGFFPVLSTAYTNTTPGPWVAHHRRGRTEGNEKSTIERLVCVRMKILSGLCLVSLLAGCGVGTQLPGGANNRQSLEGKDKDNCGNTEVDGITTQIGCGDPGDLGNGEDGTGQPPDGNVSEGCYKIFDNGSGLVNVVCSPDASGDGSAGKEDNVPGVSDEETGDAPSNGDCGNTVSGDKTTLIGCGEPGDSTNGDTSEGKDENIKDDCVVVPNKDTAVGAPTVICTPGDDSGTGIDEPAYPGDDATVPDEPFSCAQVTDAQKCQALSDVGCGAVFDASGKFVACVDPLPL